MSRNKIGHLIAGIVLCAGSLSSVSAPRAHAQTLEWVRQLGGTIAQPERGGGVSTDGLGNVFIAGFGVITPFIADTSDAFLSNYDAAGNHQWTQRIETEEQNVYIAQPIGRDKRGGRAAVDETIRNQ